MCKIFYSLDKESVKLMHIQMFILSLHKVFIYIKLNVLNLAKKAKRSLSLE